jgi:RNA recognition motif-containing protein
LKIYADDWVTVHKNISIKNIEDKEEILRYIEVLDKIEKLYNEELEKCVNLYNKKYDDFFEKKNQESIQKNIQETENIFDKYKN